MHLDPADRQKMDVHMQPKQCNVDLENIEEALTPDPQLQVAFSCEKPCAMGEL